MKESLPTSQKITMRRSNISNDGHGIENGGRGVCATEDIAAGETIEVCPMLAVEGRWMAWLLRLTPLRNYFFQWGPERKRAAFALGYGSLYNHKYDPNAHYEKDIDVGTITFSARRDIEKGEEITINYNGHPEDMRVLWDDTIGHPEELE